MPLKKLSCLQQQNAGFALCPRQHSSVYLLALLFFLWVIVFFLSACVATRPANVAFYDKSTVARPFINGWLFRHKVTLSFASGNRTFSFDGVMELDASRTKARIVGIGAMVTLFDMEIDHTNIIIRSMNPGLQRIPDFSGHAAAYIRSTWLAPLTPETLDETDTAAFVWPLTQVYEDSQHRYTIRVQTLTATQRGTL